MDVGYRERVAHRSLSEQSGKNILAAPALWPVASFSNHGGGHDLRIAPLSRYPSDRPALRDYWWSEHTFRDPAYMQNPLRQDLWRAGHAHAGVWLILALVALRYVDEANLSNLMKWIVRGSFPIAAILVPAAFFLSVPLPDARVPNGLIYLAYVGAVLLAVGALALGVGLVRRPAQRS